jgi:hypothetical protein
MRPAAAAIPAWRIKCLSYPQSGRLLEMTFREVLLGTCGHPHPDFLGQSKNKMPSDPSTGFRWLNRWLTLKAFGKKGKKPNDYLVGVAGFEPATPASRTQCSTGLSHTPTRTRLIALGFAYRKNPN